MYRSSQYIARKFTTLQFGLYSKYNNYIMLKGIIEDILVKRHFSKTTSKNFVQRYELKTQKIH